MARVLLQPTNVLVWPDKRISNEGVDNAVWMQVNDEDGTTYLVCFTAEEAHGIASYLDGMADHSMADTD